MTTQHQPRSLKDRVRNSDRVPPVADLERRDQGVLIDAQREHIDRLSSFILDQIAEGLNFMGDDANLDRMELLANSLRLGDRFRADPRIRAIQADRALRTIGGTLFSRDEIYELENVRQLARLEGGAR